jgi:hypothetical protein
VRGEVNSEGKRMADGERMIKTADSERTMKMVDDGLFFVAKGYWCLFLLCCLFTRTFYRVFILQCEYPMRLFLFRVYKGNEKMGIRKMVT